MRKWYIHNGSAYMLVALVCLYSFLFGKWFVLIESVPLILCIVIIQIVGNIH